MQVRVRRSRGYRGPDRRGVAASATAGGYRGPDRRSSSGPASAPARGRVLALAAVAVAALVALAATTTMRSLAAFTLLKNTADILLLLAGLAQILVWRLTGRAAPALTGAGFVVMGGLMMPLQATGLLLHHDPLLQRLSPACVLVLGVTGAYLCLRSTSLRSVVSTLRPMNEAAAMAMASVVALMIMGGIRAGYGVLDGVWPWRLGVVLTAAAWFAAAAGYLRPTARDLPSRYELAAVVAGWGFGDVLLAWGLDDQLSTAAAATAVQTVAALGALLVGVAEVERCLGRQGSRALRLAGELGDTVSVLAQEQAARRQLLHDARSTLAAIRLANGTLTRYQQQLDEMLQDELRESVDSELVRLEHMLSNDHGLERVDFDLAETLAPVIEVIREAGLAVRAEVDGAPRVYGRPVDTCTIVHNLLTNAAQYAGDGPVDVTVRCEPEVVSVLVSDLGPGVDAAEREAIFQRGVRGSAANGREGSGLGLFIARWLADEQDGTLEVEDRPGGGATFVVTLPASKPADLGPAGELSGVGRPG